jgi:hypothetical protein
MEIDITIARKVLQTVDAGLVRGMGKPVPGEMCVEAAVCYAMGLPHGDEPSCVAPALRRLKIRLNDSNWSSDVARSRGMRRLALAQLGSAGALDEKEFAKRCARLAIQTCVPAALRAAASIAKPEQKERLLAAAATCEQNPTAVNAREAQKIADATYAAAAAAYDAAAATTYAYDAAAAYAAAAAAYDAAAAAAYDAAAATTYAYDAAAATTYAAAAADATTYAAADATYARDRSLTAFAEGVVQILIEMKAPGCEWLGLTEDEGGLAA